MPQIQRGKKATATTIKEAKPFRDRLRDRYAATQYVRVKNIDTHDFEWQYFPIEGELEEFTDNGAVRVVTGRQAFTKKYEQALPGNEQIWMIPAGQEEVLLGANADLFIEGLFKLMVSKGTFEKFLGKNYDPEAKRDYKNAPELKFNWNDGLLQEQFIDEICLGVEQPNFDFRPPTAGNPSQKTATSAK